MSGYFSSIQRSVAGKILLAAVLAGMTSACTPSTSQINMSRYSYIPSNSTAPTVIAPGLEDF